MYRGVIITAAPYPWSQPLPWNFTVNLFILWCRGSLLDITQLYADLTFEEAIVVTASAGFKLEIIYEAGITKN